MLEEDRCDDSVDQADQNRAYTEQNEVPQDGEGSSCRDCAVLSSVLQHRVKQDDCNGIIDDSFTEEQTEQGWLLIVADHGDSCNYVC